MQDKDDVIQLNDKVYWNGQFPEMLVDEILDGGDAICTWRESIKGLLEVRREKFKLSQLSKIRPEIMPFA